MNRLSKLKPFRNKKGKEKTQNNPKDVETLKYKQGERSNKPIITTQHTPLKHTQKPHNKKNNNKQPHTHTHINPLQLNKTPSSNNKTNKSTTTTRHTQYQL